MNGYDLSRRWFDFAFLFPGRRTPTHAALYFWYVEWANRLGWPSEFDMAPNYAMVAIGVKHHQTYNEALEDLCSWGLVKVIRKGANQHAPARLALVKNDEAMAAAIAGGLSKNDKANKSAQSKNDKAPVIASSDGLSKNDKADDKADAFAQSENDRPRDDITINSEETKTINPNLDDDGQNEGVADGEKKEGPPLDAELVAYTERLSGDRRLHEAMHRNLKITDEAERNRWIADFVFDQWTKGRLSADRNNADLITHCQSWTKIKRQIEIDHANNPAKTDAQPRRRNSDFRTTQTRREPAKNYGKL